MNLVPVTLIHEDGYGINGLSKIVGNELKHPLLSGDAFIFFGKHRQMVKLLCWDGDGFLL